MNGARKVQFTLPVVASEPPKFTTSNRTCLIADGFLSRTVTMHGTKKYVNGVLTDVSRTAGPPPPQSTTTTTAAATATSCVPVQLRRKTAAATGTLNRRSSSFSSAHQYAAGAQQTTTIVRSDTMPRSTATTQKPVVLDTKILSIPPANVLDNRRMRSHHQVFLYNCSDRVDIAADHTAVPDMMQHMRQVPRVKITRSCDDLTAPASRIGIPKQNCTYLNVPNDDSDNESDGIDLPNEFIPSDGETEKQIHQFWDLLDRWRKVRRKAKVIFTTSAAASAPSKSTAAKALATSCAGQTTKSAAHSNQLHQTLPTRSNVVTSGLRSLRIMSLDRRVPCVTTLLRASRDANEPLLKDVFRDILINGIAKDDLNCSDKSGRTALSYICSTNLTNFLDLFLQLPGIDVNRADNEGNAPLHFAAQAGQADTVNMLLTRSRSIMVDARNNQGFTPLMKAALQGRTKCAKLLLFAGASPVEIDAGRGLRAEQWARFCGRYTCAEMIEKCGRARLLEKSTSCKWPNDATMPLEKLPITRTRTSPGTPANTNGGFRSKFRKVFPFGLSFRDRTTKEQEMCKTDLVTYLTAAALCASGPVLPSHGNARLIKSLIRPLEVPKLEVTPANNQALIKKYESAQYSETDLPATAIPAVPPRGKVKKH